MRQVHQTRFLVNRRQLPYATSGFDRPYICGDMAEWARHGMIMKIVATNVIKRPTHCKKGRDLRLVYIAWRHPRSRTNRGHSQQQSGDDHQKWKCAGALHDPIISAGHSY
ncbi:MAG: hypothetical protein ACJAXK_000620 [Yoonia sp.]|jgi:hypothetical protein